MDLGLQLRRGLSWKIWQIYTTVMPRPPGLLVLNRRASVKVFRKALALSEYLSFEPIWTPSMLNEKSLIPTAQTSQATPMRWTVITIAATTTITPTITLGPAEAVKRFCGSSIALPHRTFSNLPLRFRTFKKPWETWAPISGCASNWRNFRAVSFSIFRLRHQIASGSGIQPCKDTSVSFAHKTLSFSVFEIRRDCLSPPLQPLGSTLSIGTSLQAPSKANYTMKSLRFWSFQTWLMWSCRFLGIRLIKRIQRFIKTCDNLPDLVIGVLFLAVQPLAPQNYRAQGIVVMTEAPTNNCFPENGEHKKKIKVTFHNDCIYWFCWNLFWRKSAPSNSISLRSLSIGSIGMWTQNIALMSARGKSSACLFDNE